MNNFFMVQDKIIGQVINENVLVYENYRKFYSSNYNVLNSVNIELKVYDKLLEKGISWIRIIENHDNDLSKVHETKIFFFPLKFFELFNICEDVEHSSQGFSKNIGISRELLDNFCIQTITRGNNE